MTNLHCLRNRCRGCSKCRPEIPQHEKISAIISRLSSEFAPIEQPIILDKSSKRVEGQKRRWEKARSVPGYKSKRVARQAAAFKSPYAESGINQRSGANMPRAEP